MRCQTCGSDIDTVREPYASRDMARYWHTACGEHSGVAASWCPVCGDCTCPRTEDGEPVEYVASEWPGRQYVHSPGVPLQGLAVQHDIACPLHGLASTHADRLLTEGSATDG